jgi:hypothetical protein
VDKKSASLRIRRASVYVTTLAPSGLEGHVEMRANHEVYSEPRVPTYKKYCFQLQDQMFAASSESEKQEWISALKTLIATLVGLL